jgi:hypothetical protein
LWASGERSARHNLICDTRFADPRTDFVFHRLFGTEEHKDLLVARWNALLELDQAHQIIGVELLSPSSASRLKFSIVDVKCTDAQGTTYRG